MKLVNGVGHPVEMSAKAILAEAAYEGSWTNIVFAKLDDGSELSISQHEDGEWNVTLDHEPVQYFDDDDRNEALREFVGVLSDRGILIDIEIPKAA